MNKKNFYNLSQENMIKILDNIYNEIYVTDKDLNILYVNERCKDHYNLSPEEMIGHNHNEFINKYWYPSILKTATDLKRRLSIEQAVKSGKKIIATATPVLNEEKNVKFVVSIVQEKLKKLDLTVEQARFNLKGEPSNIKIDNSEPIEIIIRSKQMQKLLSLSKKAADSDIPIFISGESGTGKTMLAKYIHNNSPRKDMPFMSINCAAIPENLLESELFGYAPHAFTGANPKGKEGLVSLANNGTLFLDEIAELAPTLQAKLLNVVENCQFIPIGDSKAVHVNVRIISATNKNLIELVKEKKFREDLFWRLNILDIKLPSLLERPEDIIPMANYYLNIFNEKYNSNKFFSEEVIDIFTEYHWPGNIRQLKNIIESSFVVSQRAIILPEHLPNILTKSIDKNLKDKSNSFDYQLERFEKNYILKMYSKYKTSRELGTALNISQSKANKLINKYCVK